MMKLASRRADAILIGCLVVGDRIRRPFFFGISRADSVSSASCKVIFCNDRC